MTRTELPSRPPEEHRLHPPFDEPRRHPSSFRERLNRMLFRTDTPQGRAFGIVLMLLILTSVVALILESALPPPRPRLLVLIEWGIAILFGAEYLVRLYAAHEPRRYASSFFGLVDLLSVVSFFAGLALPASHYLLALRSLRLLRFFRVFDMAGYLDEAEHLVAALRASYRKIVVFVFGVMTAVMAIGALIFAIEGPAHGFTSLWSGIYWAIATLTTVDSGGLRPMTPLGQGLAVLVMILGYGVIAVPTGIVSVEISGVTRRSHRICPNCGAGGHPEAARYCYRCGAGLGE